MAPIDLKLNQMAGDLRLSFSGGTAGTYNIEIHRIDAQGDQVFRHMGNAGSTADWLHLAYGSWTGEGATMNLEIDRNKDGTIDQTLR